MSDAVDQARSELYELMQRLRHASIVPAPTGLTQAEARVISAIQRMQTCEKRIRPGMVAESTHTTPSALSQTLKALEEKGLIERNRTSGDYRGVALSLTAEGERLALEVKQLHTEHLNQVLAYVGEDDMRHLVRILKKVLVFHDEMGNPADLSRTGEEGGQTDEEKGGCPCA